MRDHMTLQPHLTFKNPNNFYRNRRPEIDYLQRQSPFFGLPREIRDTIYELCVTEKDGYFYDFASRKFSPNPSLITSESIRKQHAARQPVRLGLMLACNIAADEMKGLALRSNTLTFVSSYSRQGNRGYRGLGCKAGRFRCCKLPILAYELSIADCSTSKGLKYLQMVKMQMVCVVTTIFQRLRPNSLQTLFVLRLTSEFLSRSHL